MKMEEDKLTERQLIRSASDEERCKWAMNQIRD